MSYARIVDGKVWEIVPWSPTGKYPPSWVWVECGDEVVQGAVYDAQAGTFTNPEIIITPPPDLSYLLADAKARLLNSLALLRWQKETGGIIVNGAPITTDRETANMLTAAFVVARSDPNFSINWKAAAGVFVTLDAPTIVAIATAVRHHVQACFDREAALSAEITAAVDSAALSEIDTETGWPTEASTEVSLSPYLYAVAMLTIDGSEWAIAGVELAPRFSAAIYMDVGSYILFFAEELPDADYIATASAVGLHVAVQRYSDMVVIGVTDQQGAPADPAELSLQIVRAG